MQKLSEINIRPLRIAFDHYAQRNVYIDAVTKAAECGIMELSNYLLYNFEDEPSELYYRMKINVDLCEKLRVTIYSFPMKYHPISDPEYFKNRDYLGKHWNRKFIRAVQAVLNSTKGKIGKGVDFFEIRLPQSHWLSSSTKWNYNGGLRQSKVAVYVILTSWEHGNLKTDTSIYYSTT